METKEPNEKKGEKGRPEDAGAIHLYTDGSKLDNRLVRGEYTPKNFT